MSKYAIYALVLFQSSLMAFANDGNAQRKRLDEIEIDLSVGPNALELEELILKIQQNSEFTFAYKKADIKNKTIRISDGKWNLKKLLTVVSAQSMLSVRRINETISLVTDHSAGFPEVKDEIIQQFTVSGVVKDELGEPLPGATIIEKGTTNGTIADIEGNFSLTLPEDAVILVSFVGYQTLEVNVAGKTLIEVDMVPDFQSLEEVIVVGYGTVKKSDLTGSVVKVKQEDITALPVTNALESLQGKVAGMDLTRSSGDAGSGLNIKIRGTRSITANNGPLILVDGMPYGNNLDIPPSEIESIEVLKDASSTAIYGSRGANGVILITTKRGKSGQARVSFNMYSGVNSIVGYPEFTSGDDWIEMKREAYKTIGEPIKLTDQQIFGADYDLIQNGHSVDWRDLIFKDGAIQNYQLGASGGSEKTTYSILADFIKESGVIRLDDYQRYLLRATVDHQMNDWIRLGTSVQYSRADDGKRGNPLNQANKQPPFAIPYNEDGTINYNPFGDPNIVSPLADEIPGAFVNDAVARRVLSNSYLQIKPLEGLSLKSSISFVFSDDREGYFAARQSLARSNQVSQAKYNSSLYDSYQWENTITFDKTIGIHGLQVVGGNAAWKTTTERYGIEALDVNFDNMSFYNLSATDPTTRTISSSFTQTQLLSFFGRFNYTLASKYLFTFVLRADGASQLAKGNKWQSFPSAAFAWKVSEESFMKNQEVLSFMKLRASYGLSGNSAVSPYQTDSRLGQTMYSWGESVPATGYYLRSMAAEDLGWETTSTFNVAADFGFLSDRISVTVEKYWMHTTDLLLNKKLPFATGYPAVMANVGETKNNGIEAIVSSTNMNLPNGLKWTTDVTFSANKEKIVKLADSTTRDISNGWFVGHPVDVFFDYDKIGIWQLGEEEEAQMYRSTLGPGEIKVRDVNGDTLLTDADKVILGNPRPKWTIGINNRVEYKGFDLSMFVFARIGQMINSELHSRFDRGALGVSYKADYWTEENPTNAYPKPNRLSPNQDLITTLGYRNGSFVKIRNITLGYSLPKQFLSKAGISQLRFYSTLKNYFTFSELTPYDPERGGRASSPMTKQWIFGLNLTF